MNTSVKSLDLLTYMINAINVHILLCIDSKIICSETMVYDTINIIYTVQSKYMIKHHKLSTLKFIHPLFYSLVSWLGSTSFQQLKCSSDHKSDGYQTSFCSVIPRGEFIYLSLSCSSHTEELTNLLHTLVIESWKPQRDRNRYGTWDRNVFIIIYNQSFHITLVSGKTNDYAFFSECLQMRIINVCVFTRLGK